MDYNQFKEEVIKLVGIDLSEYKENQMKRRIDSIIRKNNCQDYKAYVELIKNDSMRFKEFVNHLTINVSEFYRNPSQWQVLEKEVLPFLLTKNRNIKIWSAACSTGQEPYSLAMVLSKFLPLHQIQIIATDIDEEVIKKAKLGQYMEKDLLNLPSEFKNQYFEKQGDTFHIKSEIKRCVTFKQHNLLKDPYLDNVDLIVCRNVLIYFTTEAKDTIFNKFSKSLSKEGILFVGSTEQIMSPSQYNLELYRLFFYKQQK